jgi:hypothetical protein
MKNLRRFRIVRMWMLLLKQNKIAQLEEELNKIDREEEAELWLGSWRKDRNACRKDVLARLDETFSDYGNSPNHVVK